MLLKDTLGGGINIGHVQDNADISIAKNRASVDAGIFDVELLQISRQRFYDHLVFANQPVHEQAICLVVCLHIRMPSLISVRASGMLYNSYARTTG